MSAMGRKLPVGMTAFDPKQPVRIIYIACTNNLAQEREESVYALAARAHRLGDGN
ncbi:hypothetical protein D3C77_811400 [compost metagenome]|jgi:hypothetical protein